MRIDIVTIFPEMFGSVFRHGIVRRAAEAGRLSIVVHDLRDWTKDRHRSTDDAPYGGGPGMVMMAEPLVSAVEAILREDLPPEDRAVVLLSPRGEPLKQQRVFELAGLEQIVLVAGRYEGVDERFLQLSKAEELSIGDYVLSGGEIPAMVMVDAVVRLLPGATSDPESVREESFTRGFLDFPQYTRPAVLRGLQVPEVLLSGKHAAIRRWRKEQALRATLRRRPELLEKAEMDDEERAILKEVEGFEDSGVRSQESD